MSAEPAPQDEQVVQQFFDAIQAGDRAAVGQLLESDPGLLDAFSRNTFFQFGLFRNALYEAMCAGCPEMITALLEATVRTGRRPKGGVLLEAVRTRRADLVRSLLEAGADPDERDLIGSFTWSPLALAAHRNYLEIVQMLVEAGADVNLRLADPDFPSRRSLTALTCAVRRKRQAIIDYLLPLCSPQTRKRALAVGPETPEELFGTLLMELVQDPEEFQLALADGADPNGRTPEGHTALHRAATYGNADAVRMLLEAGADINAADRAGRTALFMAVDPGHREIVSILLEAGAEVDIADYFGQTPLFRSPYPGIVRLLLAAGADPNRRDRDGLNPLRYISQSGEPKAELLELFKSAGASLMGGKT